MRSPRGRETTLLLSSHHGQGSRSEELALRPPEDLIARASDELPELDETAHRVLEAARAVFLANGVRRSTMEDVAKQAGLGRATLYRRFAGKEALVQHVLLREMQEYLLELDAVTDDAVGFAEQMVEGFVTTLRYVRERSLLQSVMAKDGEWGLVYFVGAAGPVLGAARDYLVTKMRAAQARGEAATSLDVEGVAEVLVRVCHSLMLTPEGVIPYDDDEAARTFARSVLVPMVSPR